MIFEGRIVLSAIILAVFAGMVGLAATFPPEARFLPWTIGIPGLILCIVQLAIEVRSKAAEAPASTDRSREWRMFAWLVAFTAAILLFGFVYAGPVMVALYLHFDWREKPLTVLIAAFVAWTILYGVFEWALELRLFDGFLGRWLPG